ncbi:type 4 fimbrial biogenesis protein PilY1 [Candidatus Magnetomorum sp. HK-1]|nr:type 4 fimbrial biogenesis protein PilY1 [Candidatus Magnetomorum sp. HK-1]
MKDFIKDKTRLFVFIFVIITGVLLQPVTSEANVVTDFFDKMRSAVISLIGIRVDFVGNGINNPQPTCADGANWDFASTELGQAKEDLCSGDTFGVELGTIVDNSFIMSIIETMINWVIDTLNAILKWFGVSIGRVDFAYEYVITFSKVDGWAEPAPVTDYIELIAFKVIKTKKFCIKVLFWDICFKLPIQFGMSHKVTYKKLEKDCCRDLDGDGYGDPADQKSDFVCGAGWVEKTFCNDCDDNNSSINPGVGNETACNGLDDDCDTQIDEGLKNSCYRDFDNDGCGDINHRNDYCNSDGPPSQCVKDSCDCDDSDPNRYAGNTEIKCDDIDQDCNGEDLCPDGDCMTISDIPLETLANPAPPLILFVLDDSGSMDQDILTEEENGDFKVDSGSFWYVFNAPDNTMTHVQENAGDWEDKLYYRSQWYEYNKVYYKPQLTYDPWPRWDKLADTDPPAWSEVPNANPKFPRSNPVMNIPINLNQTFVLFDSVKIKRSHYYVFSKQDSKMFLVNINLDTGTIDYYLAEIASDHKIKKLSPTNDPPSDVLSSRGFDDELQNFANWFSFYRRRMHTAKAAIARVIDSLEGVQIGLLTINRNNDVRLPAVPIRCRNSSGTLDDRSDELLNVLYKAFSNHGTPLRTGLEKAGQYFTENGASGLGQWPYASVDDGGECQQAFSIIITDGFWNGADPSVDNADGDDSSDFDTDCFSDNFPNTLADVAMHYYENDLSSGLENKVPSRFADINIQQHMVTYSVAFGIDGTLKPFDDYPSCPADNAKTDCSAHCPTWPKPKADKKTTIDDLWHAAVNGRGEYFSANNPQDLINAMELIGRQISLIGNAASVSVNGPKLENNSLIFQGSYNSSDWSGDLKAFGVSGGSDEFDFDNAVWSARENLDKKKWSDRMIITSNGGKGGILFKNVPGGELLERIHSDEAVARRIINYISGDDSEEQKNGGPARTRYHKLGDIIHSQPLFFKDFVFIGGNAGMAHVFNAKDGEEVGAYVPNLVFDNLLELCIPNYSHKFFCDATPTVKEADDGTYLVGGLGKGGRGYYCLKVTEPDIVSMPKWEFPPYSNADNADDVKMGYSYSTPSIVNSNANQWIVLFGNGYASKRGKAALYIRNLKTGEKIVTFDTKVGSYDLCNGLSTPTLVDVNFDEKVDYAYAGDLLGNLWKFDLTSNDPTEWKIAYGTPDDPKPLFQAMNSEGSDGTPQPITSKPDVMSHCVHGRTGFIVVFGTGRYLTEGDTQSINTQSIYGIWDWQDNDERNNLFYYGSFKKDRTLSNAEKLPDDYQKIRLLEQSIDSGYTSEGYKVVTDNPISWYPDTVESSDISHVGWYFDLPDSHERIIDNPLIREGKVIVVTLIPATSKCGIKSHSSIYILDACNGGRLVDPVIKIDDNFVEIEPDDNTQPKLPPSVIKLDVVVKPPAFIHTEDGTDMMLFGDMGSDSQIPEIKIDSDQGRYYWKF